MLHAVDADFMGIKFDLIKVMFPVHLCASLGSSLCLSVFIPDDLITEFAIMTKRKWFKVFFERWNWENGKSGARQIG